MITFSILKKSKRSAARLGLLKTPHGEIETPALVPVATRAAVKTLTSQEVFEYTNSKLLIANTFHLHLRPGEDVVKKMGGLHKFMNWNNGGLMTDSGGFQVFSLGFGKDLGVGKKPIQAVGGSTQILIKDHHQPAAVKITDDGVRFHSPVDGSMIFLGPRESISIQEKLGADIIFAFDECTPPRAQKSYIEKSINRTHAWAKICRAVHKTDQALYGIVQGSHYRDLRQASAKYLNSLEFDGYGIGGDLGESKSTTCDILKWSFEYLDESKPRHLLGIGKLEDMAPIIGQGVDTFDCTVPTHFARHGTVFTSKGKLNINRSVFLTDKKPLDPKCSCRTCAEHSRGYIAHLMRSGEITGMRLLTVHNLFFFHAAVARLRDAIRAGKL